MSRGRPAAPPVPQRLAETAPAGAPAVPRPAVKLLAKAPEPASTPSPQPAGTAPSRKNEPAVAVAAPPAAAAKPAAPKPAPAAAEPEPDEPSGGLFVPVLSTHKDAKAAREAFAELQKQHAAVLGAKQSEVQASASATGTWHRLVVTPATSKEAATEVCNKLRAAGYARCWVKPY